jgi:RNA polymerase sigma-70 factor, ECF subfamily
MDIPDSELMTRLARGENDALDTLMRRWGDRIIAFLYRMTGRRDVAADLAQETFVRLYQARSRYKPSGNFSTWLFSIATNLGRNHARWLHRHPTVSIEDGEGDRRFAIAETADTSHRPDGMAVGNEISREVNQAIMDLPLDLREALTIFVHQDLGYVEISNILGCSTKAVETRIYRARQILKKRLGHLRS